MKQAKTTKQPLEDKKHVPRWLQNELYDLSMPYVDRMIEAHQKEKIGFSRFSLQSMGEQLICMGYFHANPNPPEEKPTPDSKEGLHTQGEWKFNKHEAGRYCGNIECELGKGENGIMNIRTIAIVLKNAGEEESQANAELIVKAVNERKALVNDLGDAVNQIEDLKDILEQTEFSKKKLEDERKALLDSHRELIRAANDAIATLQRWCDHDNEAWDERDDLTVNNLQTAINNAKNI